MLFYNSTLSTTNNVLHNVSSHEFLINFKANVDSERYDPSEDYQYEPGLFEISDLSFDDILHLNQFVNRTNHNIYDIRGTNYTGTHDTQASSNIQDVPDSIIRKGVYYHIINENNIRNANVHTPERNGQTIDGIFYPITNGQLIDGVYYPNISGDAKIGIYYE